METQVASARTEAEVIRRAFYDSGMRRPYKSDPDIIKAATPPGGEWACVAEPGAVCRSIIWGRLEVALMNPHGDIADETEGQIAMACRALPVMDAALRSIIVLAENAENMAAIRNLAVSVIGFVEMPAPPIIMEEDGPEPERDGDGEITNEWSDT